MSRPWLFSVELPPGLLPQEITDQAADKAARAWRVAPERLSSYGN